MIVTIEESHRDRTMSNKGKNVVINLDNEAKKKTPIMAQAKGETLKSRGIMGLRPWRKTIFLILEVMQIVIL